MSGTRVVCHLEHQETPDLLRLHVPAQHLTLAELKQLLNKHNHKFFFESVDDDFGVVKEEIRDDDAHLPSVDGRVVCWLVSSEDGRVRPAPQRTGGIGDSRPPSFHGQAEDRSEAPPAGEVPDSEPSSEEDSAQRFSRSGSSDPVVRRQRRRHRRERTPHMEKSESLSSVTDSSMSLAVVTVTLDMEKHGFLGLSIVGHSSGRRHAGVCVASVTKGGAAAAAEDARVEPGDMLLQVNDVSLENTSNDEAVRILRGALRQPGPLTLTVAKCWGACPAATFPLPTGEPVRPIDPAAWVSHTAAMSGRLLPHYSVHEDLRLTVHSDMEAVVRSMADPGSGVDVRDRLWLKITIPHAFIGSEVVDWLLRSVDGFVDRRDARRYAATLLSSGYIRHAVNKMVFSEQCYYVFGHACTDASSTHHEEVSCHSGAAAAAWEGAAERGDSAHGSSSSCTNQQAAGGRAGGAGTPRPPPPSPPSLSRNSVDVM